MAEGGNKAKESLDSKPYIPRWSKLRSIGNSQAAKLTILIPLVGYMIIFNETIASYLQLSNELVGLSVEGSGSTASPRLLLIYFGLCWVALGSAIYAWRCPGFIKRYRSAESFVADAGHHIGQVFMSAIQSELERNEIAGRLRERVVKRVHKSEES